MSSIGTRFDGRPWMFRVPPLIQYIHRKYVDDFFATGTIQLSSWRACWEAEDAERRDWSEGRYEGMVGNCAVAAFMPPVHLLCVSAVENKEMASAWQTDAGIRIVRPQEFAHAIARRLAASDAGFKGGEFGPCAYRDGKFNQWHAQTPVIDSEPTEETMMQLEECISRAALPTIFVKDVKFQPQAEWRFVWWIDAPKSDRLLIECPEARQYCESVSFM
mgnify:CR=1 FL=1